MSCRKSSIAVRRGSRALGRPKGEGLEQRGRIAADPGIALGGTEQRIGLGGRGQRLDIRLGLNQAGPADLAIEHVKGVLAGLIGLGERMQRVAEHAQQPTRLLAGIEVAPILSGLGFGEQKGNQPAEHGDRGIGQLAGQLGQLRRDQRVPAARVEVFGQPARRHRTLAHQLGPTVRMDKPAAPRIKAKRPHEAQPIEQGEQILLARRLGEGPQPGEAGLPDSGIDGEEPVEYGQFLGREAVEQRCLHPPSRDDPCGTADPVERIGCRKH